MTLKDRVAAIDIGSNAIRMVIAELTPLGFKTLKKFRFPIRLGADVFEKGRISPKNIKESARTFRKFKDLTLKFDVKQIRAVGTSALRESKNKEAFIELVRRKSSIRVEIIQGDVEAQMIHAAIAREVPLQGHRSLSIDIGGGSVELTFANSGRIVSSQSFPFGTVRTLELIKKRNLTEAQLNIVIGEYLPTLANFIHQDTNAGKINFAIGTGGNLERLSKLKGQLLKKEYLREVMLSEIDEIVLRLKKFTYKERIEKLEMAPDRADVILPALMVVQAVMRQAAVDKIVIPGVGLKDGVLWSMAAPFNGAAK